MSVGRTWKSGIGVSRSPGCVCGQYAAGTPGGPSKGEIDSGRAANRRRKADERGPDEHHRGFVAQRRSRHAHLLNRNTRRLRALWCRREQRARGRQAEGECKRSQIPTRDFGPHAENPYQAMYQLKAAEIGIGLPNSAASGPLCGPVEVRVLNGVGNGLDTRTVLQSINTL